MTSPTGSQIVQALRATLSPQLNVDETIAEFGQVASCLQRERKELFSLRDHLRGMVLAMLSANRPWRPIADNLDRLEDVFGGYRPSVLREANPSELTVKVKALRCGNTRIGFQMRAIKPNIATLEQIELEHGFIDTFVETGPPEWIAEELATSGRRYKLKEMGVALALEYLKNVGIRAIKPDRHVLRVLGPDRLGVLSGNESDAQAATVVHALCEAADLHHVEFDNLLWLYCATDYGAICTDRPRCDLCQLQKTCRFSS